MNYIVKSILVLLVSLSANADASTGSDPAMTEKAKVIIKTVIESKVLEQSFPDEHFNLKTTFVEDKAKTRFEEIQDALCTDYSKWVIDDPSNNEVGHMEHLSNCLIRLYSVERDPQYGMITKLHETYLLTAKINHDQKSVQANIEDVEKFQYDFNPNELLYLGETLAGTSYVCRFDKSEFLNRKGIKTPILNTKVQYKKKDGALEKLITVETDGEILTGISVVVKEGHQIKYFTLLNKEEIATQWGLSKDGHLVFFDYDPNTNSAGTAPRPIPELLNCYHLDDGRPANMKR